MTQKWGARWMYLACFLTYNYACFFFQWYYNNQAIKPSKYFQMTSQNGVHTLHITGAFPEDQGVYKCQALNQAGEVTCIAHLKVNGE